MKKLLFIAFTLFLGVNSLMAQDAKQIEDSNYVILLDNKVFHYTASGVVILEESLTLNNGTVVKNDGQFVIGNKSSKLTDGQCIGMSGKLYKSQEALTKKLFKLMKK